MITIPAQRDGSARVLVVDDAETNRRMLEILLKNEGYAVDSAGTARDAFSQIVSAAPDLLLLDLALPDMHGSQLLAQIKHAGFTFPVLIITGDSSPAARSTALRAAEFLIKPYDIDALLTAVGRLVGGG